MFPLITNRQVIGTGIGHIRDGKYRVWLACLPFTLLLLVNFHIFQFFCVHKVIFLKKSQFSASELFLKYFSNSATFSLDLLIGNFHPVKRKSKLCTSVKNYVGGAEWRVDIRGVPCRRGWGEGWSYVETHAGEMRLKSDIRRDPCWRSWDDCSPNPVSKLYSFEVNIFRTALVNEGQN